MASMSARRAWRMRNACEAFSSVIAIQRAGKARDGRHTRVAVPERCVSAALKESSWPARVVRWLVRHGGLLNEERVNLTRHL